MKRKAILCSVAGVAGAALVFGLGVAVGQGTAPTENKGVKVGAPTSLDLGQEVEGIPPEYDYEKIECFFQGVRDYLKFIKRGMGRTNHLANIDIRNRRMTREEGEALVRKFDGKRPPSLDLFLDYLQLTEEQFLGIAIKHEVSPWQFSPNDVQPGRKMPDMDQWNNTQVPWPNHPGVEIGGKA